MCLKTVSYNHEKKHIVQYKKIQPIDFLIFSLVFKRYNNGLLENSLKFD